MSMKNIRFLSFVIIFAVLMSALNVCAFAEDADSEEILDEPSVSAAAAVLYCGNTGEVVYDKNASEARPMASITKIMTCLLALEADDQVVEITEEMYAEGTSMYLKAGEKMTLHNLAAGMMMVSGNDSANAIALALSDSFEEFAELMTKRAKDIGMENTQFVTASGLHDDNHYTTAKDMAVLIDFAMENAAFKSIVGNTSMDIPFVEPAKKIVTYANNNKLLRFYDSCVGGKTGYTPEAGRCLVNGAVRDGVELYVVTLDAPDDWSDHEKLFEYGFSLFENITPDEYSTSMQVVGGESETVAVSAKCEKPLVVQKGQGDEIKCIVESPAFVYAPVAKGTAAGKVIYMNGDKKVGEAPLVAQADVEYKETGLNVFERILRLLGF